MFKPDTWQSHDEYRTFLNTTWQQLSLNCSKYETDLYEKQKEYLLNLNLDPVGSYLMRYYSSQGRPSKNQAQIFRSLLLFVLLFNQTPAKTSLTLWVRDVLPHSAVLRTIIGCRSPEELPPLGSYYDFMNRLWQGDRSIYARDKLFPVGKNGKKPKKNIGPDGKLEEEDKLRTKSLVDDILANKRITDNPEGILQDVFYLCAVLPSIRLGLIDSENLTISGDGTVVPSHTSCFGHIPPCPGSEPTQDNSSEELRHYADPDADWGWDSSKKTWYFGRTLYLLCCRNNLLKIELPLLINYTEAKRHDSINFLYAIDDFSYHNPAMSPRNICLDSAHDNIPTYKLLKHWGINALIDINGRSTKSEDYPDDISFDKEGHPYCRAGKKMIPWGNDPQKDAHKYRCALKCGKCDKCPYENECSPGNYGRTVYIKNDADLRFHPAIPRDSKEYKDIYRERTACERINNRMLNNYKLQYLMIRGKDHFSFWTMLMGICIHLDARYKVSKF